MVAKNSVKAVSFDLWGTLIKGNKAFKAARNEHIRNTWNVDLTSKEFDQEISKACDTADEDMLRTGNDIGFESRVLRALKASRVIPDERDKGTRIEENLRAQEVIAKDNLPSLLSPDIPELIKELASKYPLIIMSNTGMLPGSLMRELLDGLGLLDSFSVHVFSNEINISKPSAGIFEYAFTQLSKIQPGIEKQHVLHLGDNKIADVIGSNKYGFQAKLVNVEEAPSITHTIKQLL